MSAPVVLYKGRKPPPTVVTLRWADGTLEPDIDDLTEIWWRLATRSAPNTTLLELKKTTGGITIHDAPTSKILLVWPTITVNAGKYICQIVGTRADGTTPCFPSNADGSRAYDEAVVHEDIG